MDYPYSEIDIYKGTEEVFVAEGVSYPLQELSVVVDGVTIAPTQDWEVSPSSFLADADTIELEADGKLYPVPSWKDLNSDQIEFLLEKISPT